MALRLLSRLFFVIFPIALFSAECPDYLKGLANLDIPRFGGLSPRTAIQQMANLMLSYVPSSAAKQIQIAMPTALLVNDFQPQQFGDGQQNAFAHFGSRGKPPFISVLERNKDAGQNSELALILAKDLVEDGKILAVEVDILGQKSVHSLDENGLVRLIVDSEKLGWNRLQGAQFLFFRPVGWGDWFAISFPQAYLSIEQLTLGMNPNQRRLITGQSVVDPLSLRKAPDAQIALRISESAEGLGFVLARVQRSQRVHGIYFALDGTQSPTSTGGVWTRYRDSEPFKIIYLAKDPRTIDIEEEEGVVSGTGPHKIGATGEIILNSLGDDPLMTLYGIESPKVGPAGAKIAWGYELTHQWIGTWLQPDEAFVSPMGSFHWHLNHLGVPVVAQVFTPPLVPTNENNFGFGR